MDDSKGVQRVIMAELDNYEGQKRFKVWFNVTLIRKHQQPEETRLSAHNVKYQNDGILSWRG